MTRESALKADQLWAYRPGSNRPLERVRIVDPGTHYGALIRIERLEHLGESHAYVKRVKLPCRWDRLEAYLASQRVKLEEERAERARSEVEAPPRPMDGLNLKGHEAVVLLTLDNIGTLPIAYDIKSAGAMVGYSEGTIRLAISRGQLFPRYANSKGVILREDLHAWAHNLPYAPPGYDA